ncbi:MAG: transcriptional regulator [Bacteroidia bacterium]|nr:transcriptional regulator [Bacteroidia bacterium]
MKEIIDKLNKAFDHRVRLGIMSILMVNERVDFGTFKEMLDLTDGNLATHITALEKHGYLEVQKQFIGKKPNTSYAATPEGKTAFHEHLAALESLLNKNQ